MRTLQAEYITTLKGFARLFSKRIWGVEMQWQWADLSILRITPDLLGLFSIVILLTNLHARKQKLPVQQAAWYNKLPNFSDVLRIVKKILFSLRHFQTSQFYDEIQKVPRLRSSYHFSPSTHTFLSVPFG